MTEEHIKEQLSLAYTKATAAKAGVICGGFDFDYCMDGSFKGIDYDSEFKRYGVNGYNIDFQLKSTVVIEEHENEIIYDLEAKNYRDLIKEDVGTPRILILYLMPRDKNEWIIHSKERTIIKKCAWWCSLRGLPKKNNKSSVRIKIPKDQLLTSDELKRLMNSVKESGGV